MSFPESSEPIWRANRSALEWDCKKLNNLEAVPAIEAVLQTRGMR
jgi:hypothetical protein